MPHISRMSSLSIFSITNVFCSSLRTSFSLRVPADIPPISSFSNGFAAMQDKLGELPNPQADAPYSSISDDQVGFSLRGRGPLTELDRRIGHRRKKKPMRNVIFWNF